MGSTRRANELRSCCCRRFLRYAHDLCTAAIRKSDEFLRHPVGTLGTPSIGTVVSDMSAVRYNHKLHGTACFFRKAFGILPRNDAVLLSGHDEQWAGDAVCDSFQRKRRRVSPGILGGGAVAAHSKSLSRKLRQKFPRVRQVERPRQRDAGLHAFFERRRAWRVVTAQAYAP